MRLIDADALLNILERERKEHEEYGLSQRADGITDAIMDIIDAPTIEPQKMRGRWVGVDYDGYADGNPVYYTWECSVCNCLVEDEEPTWDFCPNCGADMRGTE